MILRPCPDGGTDRVPPPGFVLPAIGRKNLGTNIDNHMIVWYSQGKKGGIGNEEGTAGEHASV